MMFNYKLTNLWSVLKLSNILKQNCSEFKDAQQVSRSVTQEYLTLLSQDGSLLKKEPNFTYKSLHDTHWPSYFNSGETPN